MRKGQWKVRPGLIKKLRQEVFARENGVCQNCGKVIEGDPHEAGRTDKPNWSVHHIISLKDLKEIAREKCMKYAGEQYFIVLKNIYTMLAIDPDNLELRCIRDGCRNH